MAATGPTQIENRPPHKTVQQWTGLVHSDDPDGFLLAGTQGAIGFMQATGDFGSGAMTIQVSGDGTNWYNLKDADGNNLSLNAAGTVEFSTGALYIRPGPLDGGSAGDVDVIFVFSG